MCAIRAFANADGHTSALRNAPARPAGAGDSEGVPGSTGPNDVSPQTSGGDIGGNQGGIEGGVGNLYSGGGSGAPSGDTGGSSGSGATGAGGNGGNGV